MTRQADPLTGHLVLYSVDRQRMGQTTWRYTSPPATVLSQLAYGRKVKLPIKVDPMRIDTAGTAAQAAVYLPDNTCASCFPVGEFDSDAVLQFSQLDIPAEAVVDFHFIQIEHGFK